MFKHNLDIMQGICPLCKYEIDYEDFHIINGSVTHEELEVTCPECNATMLVYKEDGYVKDVSFVNQ